MASKHFDGRRDKWVVKFRWPKGRQGKSHTYVCVDEDQAEHKADWITRKIDHLHTGDHQIPSGVADVGRWLFTEGQNGHEPKQQAVGPTSVAELVDKWLEARRKQLDGRNGKKISHSSYDSDFRRAKAFEKFCKQNKAPKIKQAITAQFLEKYKADVSDEKKGLSPVTIKHALRTVRVIVKWSWARNYIETLPRILDEYADIDLKPKPPKEFTIEEVNRLYEDASERVKLYMLLALNCGYTSADIASLEHQMIDWDSGIVSRDRHKTEQPQEAKLWPVTLSLLKKQSSDPDKSTLALLTQDSNPVLNQHIRKDKAVSTSDSVGTAFNRLRRKLGMDKNGKGFKVFRKTGATLIEHEHGKEMRFLYLAHVESGMGKFYVVRKFQELHTATDWLLTLFRFTSR